MTIQRPVESVSAGFQALGPVLRSIGPDKLLKARHRALELPTDELINRCRAAMASRKRIASFVLNEALTRRGIAPAFRVAHLSSARRDVNYVFDLLVADAGWLRTHHSDHSKRLKYKRSRGIFGSDSSMLGELEYAYFRGERASWKIVKSLSLTEQQQLDCVILRSAPIVKRMNAVQAMRDRVFGILQLGLASVRRTATFTNDDAKCTLMRRHRLWLCRAHTSGGPAEIAKTYEAITGEPIDRKVVARQLQIIDATLKKGDRR